MHATKREPATADCSLRLAETEERLARVADEKATLHQDLVFAIQELDKQKFKNDDMMAQVSSILVLQ